MTNAAARKKKLIGLLVWEHALLMRSLKSKKYRVVMQK